MTKLQSTSEQRVTSDSSNTGIGVTSGKGVTSEKGVSSDTQGQINGSQSTFDLQSEDRRRSDLLKNKDVMIQTYPYDDFGNEIAQSMEEFHREIQTFLCFIARAKQMEFNKSSMKAIYDTLIAKRCQILLQGIIQTDTESTIQSLDEITLSNMITSLERYLVYMQSNATVSATDLDRVIAMAENTLETMSQVRTSNNKYLNNGKLVALHSPYLVDKVFYEKHFKEDYNHLWAERINEKLKKARLGTTLHNFYMSKTELDSMEFPNATETDSHFLPQRYTVTRVMHQFRKWFTVGAAHIAQFQCLLPKTTTSGNTEQKYKKGKPGRGNRNPKDNDVKSGESQGGNTPIPKQDKQLCYACGNYHNKLTSTCTFLTRQHPEANDDKSKQFLETEWGKSIRPRA